MTSKPSKRRAAPPPSGTSIDGNETTRACVGAIESVGAIENGANRRIKPCERRERPAAGADGVDVGVGVDDGGVVGPAPRAGARRGREKGSVGPTRVGHAGTAPEIVTAGHGAILRPCRGAPAST